MARVVVDYDRCTGHGRCYSVAEDLLPYDEEGFVQARHEDLVIAADQVSLAQQAAAACPEGAMTIVVED
ncbi:ferredoxin [Nocardioides sp. J9]|uniref:ferredoxin n=1 Tax=Nocardioides sp. J9 TaxID=935844 RepID=UPI0011A81DE6|nr:ferredoxin [Nocardioides sp. J9]TWG96342.1 ferredoxin [Nocardioides sp. J9]